MQKDSILKWSIVLKQKKLSFLAYLCQIKYTFVYFSISQTAAWLYTCCWFMTLVGSGRHSGSSLRSGSTSSNCCIRLSCIAVKGWLSGHTDRNGLGLLCISANVCACQRYSDQRITSNYRATSSGIYQSPGWQYSVVILHYFMSTQYSSLTYYIVTLVVINSLLQ